MVQHFVEQLLMLVHINEHLLRVRLHQRTKEIAPVAEQHWVQHFDVALLIFLIG